MPISVQLLQKQLFLSIHICFINNIQVVLERTIRKLNKSNVAWKSFLPVAFLQKEGSHNNFENLT